MLQFFFKEFKVLVFVYFFITVNVCFFKTAFISMLNGLSIFYWFQGWSQSPKFTVINTFCSLATVFRYFISYFRPSLYSVQRESCRSVKKLSIQSHCTK